MMVERKAAGRTAATPEVQHVFRYNGRCAMAEQKTAWSHAATPEAEADECQCGGDFLPPFVPGPQLQYTATHTWRVTSSSLNISGSTFRDTRREVFPQ